MVSVQPIVLDLDADGFAFTGRDDPVYFDIDADGVRERIGWTKATKRDGFLVLDRNHNGLIDDGSELFGNATRLSDGSVASNGYIALVELDFPLRGGNLDGLLDDKDASFEALRVWLDQNHNGVSETSELHTLDSLGIRRIGTEYRYKRSRHKSGNLLLFFGRAWQAARVDHMPSSAAVREVTTVDVFFVGDERPGARKQSRRY